MPFTILVAAAPVLGSDLVENVLQPLFQLIQPGHGARFADYESWSGVTANHQDLLARIAAHHPAVLLSGDVHYGFTSRLTRTEGGVTTRAAQLTASAAKNLEAKNTAISMFSELAHAARARTRPRDLRVRAAVERRQDEAPVGASRRLDARVGRRP